MEKISLKLDGNYHQFHLNVGEKPSGEIADAWSEEAFKRHLAVAKDCIAVGTATTLELDVEINILESPPDLNIEEFDHIIEASLKIDTGQLIVSGCVDYLPSAKHIKIPSGTYRVRTCIKNLKSVKDEFDGEEKYILYVWPQVSADVNIIKQESILI